MRSITETKWEPEKKDPLRGSFFVFLPAFGRCCPSVSDHPANRIRCSSNIAIADHFPSKTFSFKHHLTGEAVASLQISRNSNFSFKHHLTGEAWPACRAILPFHSNTTQQTVYVVAPTLQLLTISEFYDCLQSYL